MAQQPHSYTNFSGAPPMGLWDPARATQDFEGHLTFVGGSLPEEGHYPEDTYPAHKAGTEVSQGQYFDLANGGSSNQDFA